MLLILTVLLALYVAWGIGSNEETFASPVASRAIKIKHAVVLSGIAAFFGAVLFGGGVSHTLRENVLMDEITLKPVFAIMLSAGLWFTFCCWRGWPISSTTSLVGAILGVAFITNNPVNWKTIIDIILSWITSPIAGFLVAFMTYTLFARVVFTRINNFEKRENFERLMALLQIFITFGSVFSRAANDVAQAIFFFEKSNPLLFRTLGGAGIALGLFTVGKRVIGALGTQLVELSPSAGLAVQFSTMATVSFFTWLGMPISGSVVFVAALMGAGRARRKTVNKEFFKEIVFSWIVTMPVTALTGIIIYILF